MPGMWWLLEVAWYPSLLLGNCTSGGKGKDGRQSENAPSAQEEKGRASKAPPGYTTKVVALEPTRPLIIALMSSSHAGGGCQAGANTMKIGWDIPQRATVLTRRQHAATALRGAWGCSADTAGRGRGAHEVELGQSGSKHGKHPLAVSGVSVWSGISEIVWVLCVFPYRVPSGGLGIFGIYHRTPCAKDIRLSSQSHQPAHTAPIAKGGWARRRGALNPASVEATRCPHARRVRDTRMLFRAPVSLLPRVGSLLGGRRGKRCRGNCRARAGQH